MGQDFLSWLFAFAPILVLLIGLLVFRWETIKAGAVAWMCSIIVAYIFFKAPYTLLALANCKGVALSIYVLLIIWGAIFLYNIADEAGAIKIIASHIQRISDDPLLCSLLLAWCFTSLLQGLAGFGVPVAVVAPIMSAMGYDALSAVAACLLGHSWSISFGSMGSSYNSIQLVTKIPGEIIAPWMAIIFSLPIFLTGGGVAHIMGGRTYLKRSYLKILTAGVAMAFSLWFMTYLGMPQLATLISAIFGCIVISIWAIWQNRHSHMPDNVTRKNYTNSNDMKLYIAASPYIFLVTISIILQIPFVKACLSGYYWGLDFPAVSTGLGYAVDKLIGYSKISYFSHPAPVLLISSILGYFIYIYIGGKNKDILYISAKKTVKKCITTSMGIITMVMMALVMSDSGMVTRIAEGIAWSLGNIFPLASPFIGSLGTFITGSNTNSNIMFGLLQYETAQMLLLNGVILSAAQSVGGSLGVAIAPSTIMMGVANVGLSGSEDRVLRKTIIYWLINTLLTGLFTLALSRFF